MTDAIPATAAPDGAENPKPLTKSQKKRMKAKAAKVRREAAEAEAREREVAEAEERAVAAKAGGLAGTAAARQSGNLNPHERLRLSVMSRGFSAEEVTVAMDEMWELQLRYDEVDSVVSYLESKAVQGEADTMVAVFSPDSATESTSPPTSAEALATEEVPEETKAPEEEVPAPAPSPVAAASATTSSKSKGSLSGKKAKAQPMGLMAKLEMVSNYENLNDAVFALTEWATKAAKPQEILEFCEVSKCEALTTVLRRAVLEGIDSMGSVMDMIGAILRASGATAAAVTPAAKSLGSTIVQARAVASSDVAASRGVASTVASSVAESIVSSLRRAADKLKAASQDGERAIRRIEQEVDALASTLPAGGVGSASGVVDLMTRRDTHKVAAEKYGTVASIVILSASTADGGGTDGGVIEMDDSAVEEKKNAIVSSLLGSEYDTIVSNRAGHAALEAQLDAAQASSRTEREALKTERTSQEERRKDISARIDELRLEMAQLEGEEKELGVKIAEVETKLDDLDKDCGDAVRDMKVELKTKEEILMLDDNTCVVADKLQLFEGALSKACATAAAAANEDGGKSSMTFEKMSSKIGIYFVRMRNYFKAEADCVEFMSTRAQALTNETKDLEREIAECQALGMVTNVAQMNLQLKQTRRNIDDDNAVVSALRSEAEKMRDEFMKQMNEYNVASASSGVEANRAFSSLQLSVLTGIKDAMSRIGIEDGGLHNYLDSFVGEVVAPLVHENGNIQELLGTVGDDETNSAKGISGTVLPLQASTMDNIPTAVAPSAAKAVAPPPLPAKVPKLSWAVPTGLKKPALSLLEIQEQELSAKKDDAPENTAENEVDNETENETES
mmetsp:Transcript_461/g.1401  ORF Transcript_461/g.1401 Transcript_461/m.1401 type:complete len:850 (-) Transcript_461:280-2829(-)